MYNDRINKKIYSTRSRFSCNDDFKEKKNKKYDNKKIKEKKERKDERSKKNFKEEKRNRK